MSSDTDKLMRFRVVTRHKRYMISSCFNRVELMNFRKRETINPLTLPPQVNTIDQFFRHVRLGRTQILSWILGLFIGYYECLDIFVLTATLPHLKTQWIISETYENITNLSIFVLFAAFSIIAPLLSCFVGKKKILIIQSMLMFIASIISTCVSNKWVFLGTKMVGGAVRAGLWSCGISYTCNLASTKHKALSVTMLSVCGVLSVAMATMLALLLIDHMSWRWFVLITSIPQIFGLLTVLLLLPPSPNEALNKQHVDKLHILFKRLAETDGHDTSRCKVSIQMKSKQRL